MSETLFRFHRFITTAENNNVSPMIMNAFHDITTLFWSSWIQHVGSGTVVDTEEQIVDHVDKGEGQQAYDILFAGMKAFMEKLAAFEGNKLEL